MRDGLIDNGFQEPGRSSRKHYEFWAEVQLMLIPKKGGFVSMNIRRRKKKKGNVFKGQIGWKISRITFQPG